jgi:hypothetical protein
MSRALLIFILFPVFAWSQQTISGKVVDATSRLPIPGTSVFINNTSRGTMTDNAGNFQLTNVPTGKHELIISSIGYETRVFSFRDEQLPLQMEIELKIRVRELEEVKVEPYEDASWDKWGKVFIANFIGLTSNAERCKIRNTEDIRMRYYRNSNRLTAWADKPIIIENKALGYTITYRLEHFETRFSESSSIYLGYPLFEDFGSGKYQNQRQETYNGSMMHFIRSLYRDSLEQNGFQVRRMHLVPNDEKSRVRYVYRPTSFIVLNSRDMQNRKPEKEIPRDSLAYYKKILQQPDFLEIFGEKQLTADSLVIKNEGPYKLVYFPNYLAITYMNETEEKEYARTRKGGAKPGKQYSIIKMTGSGGVWIEANGNYFDPREIFSYGYWGWADKMADNLPLDYNPEQ